MPRSITQQLQIARPPEAVFPILYTPSAIRQWWSADSAVVIPQAGGIWAASWGPEDDPEYVSAATIEVFEPPRRMVITDFRYHARGGGLPFEADFRTSFDLRPVDGGTVLTVTQEGFPDDPVADDFYAGCQRGWRDTLEGIARYLE